MSLDAELVEYVSKYHSDKYGYEFSLEDFKDIPWSKIVSYSWDANVFYKKDRWHYSLDEVKQPTEDMIVWIRTIEDVKQYIFQRSRWDYVGNMTEDMYK